MPYLVGSLLTQGDQEPTSFTRLNPQKRTLQIQIQRHGLYGSPDGLAEPELFIEINSALLGIARDDPAADIPGQRNRDGENVYGAFMIAVTIFLRSKPEKN